MSQASLAETDLLQVYQQFCASLARAQTLDAAVDLCAALLDRCLAPESFQLVWNTPGGPIAPGALAGAPARQPRPDELALLQGGELALRLAGDQVAACFVPLLAGGELVGWLFIDRPTWATDSPTLLALLAAQAGPALALLDRASRQNQRITQLEALNEISRRLSGILDFDHLLDTIYQTICSVADAPYFYIALYDASSDILDLAYVVFRSQRQQIHDRWRPGSGLAGVIVRERQAIRTDNYLAECRRRGVPPRSFGDFPLDNAWLGVPLIAYDRFIGVMTVSSRRADLTYTPEQMELLTTIASHAAVAIENARFYQRSERQARQLALLNRIGRTITSSLDPEQVPSLIMGQVTELLGVEEGSLLLTDPASGDLVFAYTTGPVGHQLLGQRLPRNTGLAGYVVQHEQSVIVNDVQHDERFDSSTDQMTGYQTRALLAVPLRGVGGVAGVIEVINRRDASPFTSEDRRLIEAVADYAVIAIENARRFAQVDRALARRAQELAETNDRLQQNLRILTALNALGMAINTTLRSADEIFGMTARGVIEITDALGACVFLHEGESFRVMVHIGPAKTPTRQIVPLLRQVAESGRPELIVDNLPTPMAQIGASALLVVPFRATQRTLGSLCVYYADKVPDASDRETTVLFATQAAVAVENLDLFVAVRGGRDQMASILASTREGIMLIDTEGCVVIANAALHQLCGLTPQLTQGTHVEQFLAAWEQATRYQPAEWANLRHGLSGVITGRRPFVSGELNEISPCPRSIEWTALTAHSSGESSGGALLVLRDITAAKEAETLRQDLTNMIVHDLRSPLASVMASIDLLVRGLSGDLNAEQRSVLNIAYANALQMLEMINTLLDISRLEAGRMPLELTDCSMELLVDQATRRLAVLAQERNTTITIDVPPDLPRVRADVELLIRVVQNLLANALRFSPIGSMIHVRAFATARAPESRVEAEKSAGNSIALHQLSVGGSVTVTVTDHGIGIAPKDQERIFTKFGQVGRRHGGTGLGLTFCKLVIEAHGGRIWVESTLGQGSTFSFTLSAVE